MRIMATLVKLRNYPVVGRIAREMMMLSGLEVPADVIIGSRFTIHHRGMGTVIHPLTAIGNDVTIYHQVTVGRADAHRPYSESRMRGIVIHDRVTIFPGAKILGGAGYLHIGAGAIVAANAVVTRSIPPGEVWGGVPARRLSEVEPHSFPQ